VQQETAPITFTGWHTQGWAFYCGGDEYIYFWGVEAAGNLVNFSYDNTCFLVTENPFAEVPLDPTKFEATITNLCLTEQSVTVYFGCYNAPPPPRQARNKAGVVPPLARRARVRGVPAPALIRATRPSCQFNMATVKYDS